MNIKYETIFKSNIILVFQFSQHSNTTRMKLFYTRIRNFIID